MQYYCNKNFRLPFSRSALRCTLAAMPMSLYPVVLHVPVAFLTTYCLLELLRFRRVTRWASWFAVKSFLLLGGTIAALAALILWKTTMPEQGMEVLIDTYEALGIFTVAFFIFLSLCTLALWAARSKGEQQTLSDIQSTGWPLVVHIVEVFLHAPLVFLFALIGLLSVTATDALSRAIIFGPEADPVTSLVYRLIVR